MTNKPSYEELEQRVKELEAEVLSNRSGFTEQKTVEKFLKLARFSSDRASDAIFWIRSDASFLYVNEAACRHLGYTQEELLSMDVADVDPDFPAERWPLHWRELREKGHFTFESRHKTKNGRIVPVEVTINYLEFEGMEYNFAFARNIASRKRVAKELELSSEIINNVGEGVYLIRVSDGNIVYTNPKFEEIFGYERGELIGKNISIVNAPTDKTPDEKALEIMEWLNEKGTWEGEILNVRKDGKTICCYAKVTTFDHPEFGRVWIGIHGEITDRKRAQAALRESEERYRTVFDESPIGIGIASFDGGLYETNRAAKDLFGFPDDYRGIKMAQFYCDPDDRTKLVDEIKVSGKVSDREIKFKRTDGTSFWGLVNFDVIILDGKKMLIASVRDITERKRLEEELIKAQRMESIGVLAGGIAHDFNNLLTIVGTRISLAKISNNPEMISDSLTTAENACKRAADITKRLLTFSKGGAPVTRTISIVELIRESAAFSSTGSHVKIETDLPDEVWPVDVDEGQISQVINNLIINAQQAMPNGGTVNVSIENFTLDDTRSLPLLPQGRYVKITVRDKGMGIKAEHLDKIFEPYFTTKQKGSGLGLATSYSIVKNHKGYIFAESQEGMGASFHIYLPASNHEIEEKKKSGKSSVVSGARILLMDDDKMLRDSFEGLLRSLGYEVSATSDGAEAVKLYKRARETGEPFDIVILDLTVAGGMGGKDALQKLIEIDPNVKAVVSSGYSDDPIMGSYSKYGFKGVLPKPYEMEELRDILEGVISP